MVGHIKQSLCTMVIEQFLLNFTFVMWTESFRNVEDILDVAFVSELNNGIQIVVWL